MLMNGHVFPFLEVPPKRVRFRLLNAFNARFVNMQLWWMTAAPTASPWRRIHSATAFVAAKRAAGTAMVQIGTEGGFLPAPVVLNSPPVQPCPFIGVWTMWTPASPSTCCWPRRSGPTSSSTSTGCQARTSSSTPTPRRRSRGEIAENDYYPGNPNTHYHRPGFGPNTRQIMKFKVGQGRGDSQSFDDCPDCLDSPPSQRLCRYPAAAICQWTHG